MAQNITIMGASYTGVPAVTLPKTGGGTARFDDASVTTAEAGDVASGKIFLASDGTITTGTSEGGGGGASNIITGTFTVGSSTGTYERITLPYSGSGYPITGTIYIEGGPYNNTSTGDTTWYSSTQRYAVGFWSFVKSNTTTSPTYTTSGAANQGTVCGIYKNSTSASTTYSRTSSMTANLYTSSSTHGTAAVATVIRFSGGGTTLDYYVASTSYGLLAEHTYRYQIIYSS